MERDYGKIGTYLYIFGLVGVAACIPTTNYGMSVSQFYLLILWMLVGLPMCEIHKMFPEKRFIPRLLAQIKVSFIGIGQNIKFRFLKFLHNKVAVVLVSLFILHVVGLIYTTDFQYAFKDLRTKLPLLAFPIIFSSMKPLNKKHFDFVLWCYILTVLIGTIFSAVKFFRQDFFDTRELSVFISHIRFCLNILFSFFILAYFLFTKNYKILIKAGIIILMTWFLFQIYIFESYISIIIITFVIIVSIIYYIIKGKKLIFKLSFIFIIIIAISLFGWNIYNTIHKYNTPPKIDFAKLDKMTDLGNEYVHDTVHFGVEEGKYVGLYYCKKELVDSWKDKTGIDISQNSFMLYTLTRYLTSKDLRKDAEGIAMLTDEDIENITNGVANYNYISRPGIKTRISKILIAHQVYDQNKNSNGSSEFQRIEYIKASWNIIKKNPLIGVGTGDIPNSFQNYYEETNSSLNTKYRLRSHNQYLSITVGFGIIGLLWFMFTMLYPCFSNKKYRYYLYIVFLGIILISMLTEDTIESQAGVTLYAYFNALLLFVSPYLRQDIDNQDINNKLT